MKRVRYRDAVITSLLTQPKYKRSLGWLILLTAATLALIFGWSAQVRADSRDGYTDGVAMTVPGQVFIYPKQGQSPMRQDRDRYECHIWAMGQTGYDPSLPPLPVRRYTRVEPAPPVGYDTAILGFTGALLGAIIGGHHHAPQGALIGGAIGAMTGLASDSARAETARRIEADQNRRNEEYADQMEDRGSEYRRAMGACLEGRGYTAR